MAAGNEHAVVLGGSMAGLLAARVLSDHFARVTLVEREPLDGGAAPRKGVPQGRHVHALLAQGLRILDRFFPDLRAALVAGGAVVGDHCQDFRWYHFGGYKANFASGLEAIFVGRPFLESEVRRRVLALPNLTRRLECDAEGLTATADRAAVTGATIRERASGRAEELAADLVVDATGRGSQAPKWLGALGYAAPPEAQVKIDIAYTSRLFRRRPEDVVGRFVVPEPPRERRAGGAFPIEGGRWLVTLACYLGERAPQDDRGFLEYARSLPAPDVAEVIADAEPLTEAVVHTFPASRRRHYEKLTRFPARFVVLGDAVCSFNPVYGQGMTVAAMEAQVLDAWLRDGGLRDPHRFFARLAKVVDIPWMLAVGEDFRYPQVAGPKAPGTALINAYVARVHRAAIRDERVALAFTRVAHLLAPPALLFQPQIAARVLLGRSRKAGGAHAGS